MRRRLFTLLSVASLLLCVATCVLWARSRKVGDGFDRDGPTGVYVQSFASGVTVRVVDWDGAIVPRPTSNDGRIIYWEGEPSGGWSARLAPTPGTTRDWWVAGIGFQTETVAPLPPAAAGVSVVAPSWSLRVPYWLVVAVSSAIPLGRAIRAFARRRRPRPGLCPACSYDLRATPDRCPECGTVPKGSTG